ncbi:MAG: Spy/CpxP family protein refolding chaperone [Gallionella sp.]
MKKFQHMILLMGTLLGASMVAPVYADEPVPATGMMRPHFDPVAKADKRLANFKDELKITRDQESVWATYAEKTRGNVKAMRDRMDDAMREPAQTAPERFDRHIALMRERLANFEKMDEALKQLYAALTPEQKIIADHHFAKMQH